jgi:hypothetical protein
MPATDQDIRDAQLRLIDAETEVARAKLTADISALAVSVMNDRFAATGRTPEARQSAVSEALAIWAAVSAETRKPDFWGAA